MMEILIGLGAVILGLLAIFAVLLAIGFFFDTDTGPAILALAFWCFIAYHLGKAVLSLV